MATIVAKSRSRLINPELGLPVVISGSNMDV